MKLTPRAKLVLLGSFFLLPMVASFVAYRFVSPTQTSNYGELLSPPRPVTTQRFAHAGGGEFSFAELQGRWVMVVADSADCGPGCVAKLGTTRQARLALGRNGPRVVRVYLADDARPPAYAGPEAEGAVMVHAPPGAAPAGAPFDRGHVYLVDPRGNVMMRWPADADGKRMIRDLQRLLKASQIG